MKYHPTKYSGRKILVVLAHPDDESFGMGGTLALYGHQGAQIHLICATRGEAGEVSVSRRIKNISIADLRERELICAAKALCIEKIHFLDYRDSGMFGSEDNNHPNAFINAGIDVVASKIAAYIRKFQPEILITFDPKGGYLHPDHIAAHKAAVRAFSLSADVNFSVPELPPFQPKRLFFHVMPHQFLRFAVRLLPIFGVNPKQFGKNKDIDLTAILSEKYPVHVKINYGRFARFRMQAAACHASQGGDKQSGFFISWLFRIFNSTEMYMCASPLPRNGKIHKDLFF